MATRTSVPYGDYYRWSNLKHRLNAGGVGEKFRGSDPLEFYSTGEEESLKRVGEVGVEMGGR